ncbi:hypothetical protein MNBD_GAMMA07-2050 [hydrothermal vent metagenome]|uniref:Uncharacterized protein n=1 Tax=hydrothermal vent metagenome TaxID=652676 RepID=A0A3B0W9G3_9ZZZZ
MKIVIGRTAVDRLTINGQKKGGIQFYTVKTAVFESVNVMLARNADDFLERFKGCDC